MTRRTHANPAADAPGRTRRSKAWRVGTPLVVLLSGSLFAVSAANSDGTDLRPGRYTDLASLVGTEADRYAGLQARVSSLDDEVRSLTGSVDDVSVKKAQGRIARLRDPAGLTPQQGPGVSVVLSDAPEEVIDSAIAAGVTDINPLVVHQQDIQAVVNALWQGGATAVTIEGQRIISTTGIKCEGNAVQLQGVPYPQPYVISAVGDPAKLGEQLAADTYLGYYREQAADPAIAVGYAQKSESEITAPAYGGLLTRDYAEPLG